MTEYPPLEPVDEPSFVSAISDVHTPPCACCLSAPAERRVICERNHNAADSVLALLGHTEHGDAILDGPELLPSILRQRRQYLPDDVFQGGPLIGRCSTS